VPSYLAREDENLKLLSPTDLLNILSIQSKSHGQAAQLDESLKQLIQKHIASGDLVLCLSAGGTSSLDEWLRKEFS
jgi:UDP-N-acetylmuramate-alanine ligase